MTKKCIECELEKPLDEFNVRKRSICKLCEKDKRKSYYQKNKDKWTSYYSENKDHISEYKKNYRNINSEEISLKQKDYVNKNKESLKVKWKEYRDNNKEKIESWLEENKEYRKEYKKEYNKNNKSKRNESRKLKRNSDNVYKIKENIRSRISNFYRYNGFKKKSKTYEILGCSFEEFKLYLESKFEDWMTWNNYGLYNGELNYGWDIDHIIPISLSVTEEDVIKFNHYTNLQPLCSKINRDIKKDNY